jgi:hypothetical protein
VVETGYSRPSYQPATFKPARVASRALGHDWIAKYLPIVEAAASLPKEAHHRRRGYPHERGADLSAKSLHSKF